MLGDEDEKMGDVIEDKIIFEIDDVIRVLRGKIISEDDIFVFLERRDGTHKINKKTILKIEVGNNG